MPRRSARRTLALATVILLAVIPTEPASAQGSPRPPTEADPSARITIHANLSVRELGWRSLVGQSPGTLGGEVHVVGEFFALDVPVESQLLIPPEFRIEKLGARMVREMRANGTLPDALVETVEAHVLGIVRDHLVTTLEDPDLQVTGYVEPDALDIRPGEEDRPMVLHAMATIEAPLDGFATGAALGAITAGAYPLTTSFPVPRAGNYPTVYDILLPDGLILEETTPTAAAVESGRALGRSWIRVEPLDDEATIELSLAVTPRFVLTHFPGVIAVGGLMLVLAIALPIYAAIRHAPGGAPYPAYERPRDP